MSRKVSSARVAVAAKAMLLAVAALALHRAPEPRADPPRTIGERIAAHALEQTTWETVYSPGYERIGYPMGDVPQSRGVCTDVVIRALRSVGHDLQRLIHEDAKANRSRYPRIAKLDSNIDHRRCPNQIAFFRRFGSTLSHNPRTSGKDEWLPGDVVFWKLGNGRDHVGVLSSHRNAVGWPLVVHNIGLGAKHEDVLFAWTLVGRYRYPKPATGRRNR